MNFTKFKLNNIMKLRAEKLLTRSLKLNWGILNPYQIWNQWDPIFLFKVLSEVNYNILYDNIELGILIFNQKYWPLEM